MTGRREELAQRIESHKEWMDFVPVPEFSKKDRGVIVAALRSPQVKAPFQKRVLDWMVQCFSMEVCRDRQERNHRFLEESLELVQALGCTRSEAHQLVDYTFDRPTGDAHQELGGVMVTAAALCFPNDLDMDRAAEDELARIWTKIYAIREKQAKKPKHAPLVDDVTALRQQAQAGLEEARECARSLWRNGAIKEREQDYLIAILDRAENDAARMVHALLRPQQVEPTP